MDRKSEPLTSEDVAYSRVSQSDPRYDQMVLARLLDHSYDAPNGCRRWKRTHTPTGYGITIYRGASNNVHRIMYQIHHGVRLTTEQYVLHRCDVRDCINPAHLWLGTAKDNNIDCAKKGRHYEATRTECPRGHPYDEQNTRWVVTKKPGGLARECRACTRIRYRLALGWTLEEAQNTPVIPPGTPTRRRFVKRSSI